MSLTISKYQADVLDQNLHASLLLSGSKGGSKSHAACLLAVQHCEEFGEKAHVLIVRLTYQGAEEMRFMLFQILRDKYQENPRKFWKGDSNEFTLKGGGRIEIGYLNHVDDLLRYRGRSYTMIVADEAADIPPPLLNQLRAEIRGSKDVICRMIATANPARPFHDYWLRYATRTPWEPFIEPDTGLPWINCPATMEDNPFIDVEQAKKNIAKDPNAEALITGDWTKVNATAFFAGAYSENRSRIENWKHLPEFGFRFKIYADHGGGASPSAFLYTATALEGVIDTNTGDFFPAGSIIVFDEYDDSHGRDSGDWLSTYGHSIERNADAVRGICRTWMTPDGDRLLPKGRVDPQVSQDHGDERRLLDVYHQAGLNLEPWTRHSRENAAAIVREMFHHADVPGERKKPGIYFTPRAEGCLATIPFLPRDKSNPNVPATKNVSDHHYDALKACAFERTLGASVTGLYR